LYPGGSAPAAYREEAPRRYTPAMETQGSPGAADSGFFSSIRQETRFFILRHAQSEGNAGRIFQGSLDLPLDASGRAQARIAGEWLATQGIASILSSPLARAAETARIAAEACGLGQATYDPVFAELDVGIFTGMSYEESRERYPDIFQAFTGASWDAVPGAEKADALYARAMRGWSLLRERALEGEGAIVCVSHGGFIQWLLRATFGCRSWMPLLSTANCGVFELLVRPTRTGLAYLQWKRLNFQAASG
jgi:phosphoserine phosphatase